MDISLFDGRKNLVSHSSSESKNVDSPDSEFFDNENKVDSESYGSDIDDNNENQIDKKMMIL